MRTIMLSCGLISALALGGCAAGDEKASDSRAPGNGGAGPGENDGNNGGAGTFSGGAGGSGGVSVSDAGVVPALPPEVEEVVDLLLPQASENFVYATNPGGGTVSVINAKTLTIRTLETGDQPTYLRTLAGTDNAIVLNVGSDTATVLRSSTSSTTTTDVDVVRGANAIGVAPDGKHAVVYYNSNYKSAGNDSGSFQDISVLTLSAAGKDRAESMTVGFRPRDVFFAQDGKRAFVVTEDGVSVLDFAKIEAKGSDIAPLFSFGGNIDQTNLDVAVTPDGHYALARAEGKSLLRLVDLNTGKVRTLDVAEAYEGPANGGADDEDAGTATPPAVEITDLDLMPSGAAAVAVLRNQAAMVVLPLPGAFDDPSEAVTRRVPGQIIGSVTVSPGAGETALLYTTAANVERMSIVDLKSTAEPRTIDIRKGVHAVTFTPDGKTALIKHTKLEGDPKQAGLTQEMREDRSFGYSLVRVATGFVKQQLTPTAVGPVAVVPDGTYLFMLFRDDASGVKEVHPVQLSGFSDNQIIHLESPPISLGIAPTSKRVFVNQDHPDGRMSFIEWLDPTKIETVTGFELNSRIRD